MATHAPETPNDIDLRLDLSEVTITFKTNQDFIQWLNNQFNELNYVNSINRYFPFITQSYNILVTEKNKYLSGRVQQSGTPEDRAKQELASIKQSLQTIKIVSTKKAD